MKASESSPRYTGKVRECCNYAVRSAKNFLQNADAGHRQPGGNGESQLRDMLKENLNTFCDGNVAEESFRTNQKAYVVSNFLTFILMLIAAALTILAQFANGFASICMIAALVVSIISLLSFFGAFGGTSKDITVQNLYAVRKPNGDVKRRVILEANLDAPKKRNISRKSEVILTIINLIGIILILAYEVISLLDLGGMWDNVMLSKVLPYISYPLALVIFIPLVLSRTVSVNSSFPGAADNLIGAYTACGALRYMSEMDLRLENTELCVLLTSGKADKNRGAKAFTKAHALELGETDTAIICLDSIYSTDTLNIVTKGRKFSKFMDEAAENAGAMVTDHNPKYHKGDWKVFQKAGVKAASLTSLPDNEPAFYHSAADNEDNLNVRAVEAAINIALEAAYLKDAD